MGIMSKTGKFLGHFFNFRIDKWIGVSFLKSTADLFVSSAKELLKVRKARYPEDFEEAVDRLSLTEAELKAQSLRYKSFAFIFVLMALLVLSYGFYLYTKKNILGCIMSISIFVYVLTQAFQYHFWYMQIETNKLGSSIKDWFYFLFSFIKMSSRN